MESLQSESILGSSEDPNTFAKFLSAQQVETAPVLAMQKIGVTSSFAEEVLAALGMSKGNKASAPDVVRKEMLSQQDHLLAGALCVLSPAVRRV